ncbi:MAG: SDR family oxidoreductase [Sphingomonadales bacterium]|nr:SDR family oxidoreductase [Sphingomonadales bacterium]
MNTHPLLQGKKGIIFGALDPDSIAWHVAEKAFAAGARFTLTNAPVALRMGKVQELAQKCETIVIGADATSMDDLESLFTRSKEILGGQVDFVLHSIGMSLNVRKGRHYTEIDYDYYHKGLDISAISFHRTLRTAMNINALSRGASVLALSYIAAQRVFPDYNDMADAKALLESIGRSFGYHLGKSHGIRVNTISQSPTFTTAGSGVKGFNQFFRYADLMSPLGNASADSCADFCVVMFSDLTRMITMQNIYHDGGFSNTGISTEIMNSVMGPTEE